MKIALCFGVILLCAIFLEQCDSRHLVTQDRISMMDQINHFTSITGALARGDYIAAAIYLINFLQQLQLHWTIRLLLRLVCKVLSIIHPAYLWLFPSTKDRGSLWENLQVGMNSGASTVSHVMSLTTLFG